MKPATIASCLALIIATIALGMSLSRRGPVSDAEISKLVDEALAKREKEFVAHLRPKFQRVFADMTGEDKAEDWSPQTLEELVAPLVKITSQMVEE